MTCKGNCTLCGLPRDRHCRCFDRAGKVIDPFHPRLLGVWEFITTERFFGSVKRQTSFDMIERERKQLLADTASGLDGWNLMRFDRDAERLRRMANGKVFALKQRMAEEQPERREREREATLQARTILESYRARRSQNSQPAT